MKLVFFALLCSVASLRAEAQISSYGEFSLSIGTGRFMEYSTPEFHLGGTVHCMGGLQYGIVALNLGLGYIVLSDTETEPYFLSTRSDRRSDFDFPVGLAVRIPLDKLIIAVGVDASGFIGSRGPLILAPHIDLLFAGKRMYRGLFIKGFTSVDERDPRYRPQYIGIGFKTTFG